LLDRAVAGDPEGWRALFYRDRERLAEEFVAVDGFGVHLDPLRVGRSKVARRTSS
jgi:hypothetical protein